jgi:hypothetical protein
MNAFFAVTEAYLHGKMFYFASVATIRHLLEVLMWLIKCSNKVIRSMGDARADTT